MSAIATFLLLGVLAAVICAGPSRRGASGLIVDDESLSGLWTLPAHQFGGTSISRMNLLCAEGLLPAKRLEPHEGEAIIAAWADRVRAETERHWYRFQNNPAEFENSPGFFRMLMLSVVLAEDFRVHYSEERKAAPVNARADDGFFASPEEVFLPGLLGPDRQGTCSSMPVLYVAVGRELGYPLKLVTTKGHMFVRWEGNGERFNVEATSHGLNRFDDEYYRHWPFEISATEEAAEGYLKSLTPPDEMAVFLSIRGMCLREAGRLSEAVEAFGAAGRLAPGCRQYRDMAADLQWRLGRQQPATTQASLRESR